MNATFLRLCIRLLFRLLPLVLALTLLGPAAQAQTHAYSWGYNGNQQLGSGNSVSRNAPGFVKSPEGADIFAGVKAVAAGVAHTVALKNDGIVFAVGYNGFGQLGDNSTTQRSIPIPVSGPGGIGFLTDVIAIAAGDYHTVALQQDGAVWTWGANAQGQLGDNTNIQRRTPVRVVGPSGNGFLADIVAVAAGSNHTLALRRDGSVFGWGFNGNGQLGNGTFQSRSTPRQMLNETGAGPLSNIVMLAAGGSHSLALNRHGAVYACGINNLGQLGDGTTLRRNLPVRVAGVEGMGLLGSIVSIAAGPDHSFALTDDDTLVAWGDNFYRQLGDGTAIVRLTPVFVRGPQGTGTLTEVAAVSSGRTHSMALKSDGSVWTWGSNTEGQLGDAAFADRFTPVRVKGPDGVGFLENIFAIAAGGYHSLALYGQGVLQITVTLQNVICSGENIRFEFRPTEGGEPVLRTLTAGPQGIFLFTDIPPGRYDVAVKGSKWLQQVTPNVSTATGNNVKFSVFLRAGDANDDNSIDVFDLAVLIESFDAVPGSSNWNDGRADYNCDESVDVFDLDLLIQNFDLIGDA